MQIATAVVAALDDDAQAVDAVQPMKSGWWIYLRTNANRERLVNQGITVTGKYIPLRSEFHSNVQQMVKVVVKDLPLHMVDNLQILSVLSDICEVASEIHYRTLWHEGKPTSIRNGDHFFYVMEAAVNNLPKTFEVSGITARVFKPKQWLHARGANR